MPGKNSYFLLNNGKRNYILNFWYLFDKDRGNYRYFDKSGCSFNSEWLVKLYWQIIFGSFVNLPPRFYKLRFFPLVWNNVTVEGDFLCHLDHNFYCNNHRISHEVICRHFLYLLRFWCFLSHLIHSERYIFPRLGILNIECNC